MAIMNFSHTALPAATSYDVFGFLNMNSSHGGGALQQYSVGEVDGLKRMRAR